MLSWFKRPLARSKANLVRNNAIVDAATPPPPRPIRPEWERVLTASLEQNCVAPSDDAILHAFDLYCEALYAPCMERRHQMADLYAEIAADIAALQALAPELIERAMARHPYEFNHILAHKEKQ